MLSLMSLPTCRLRLILHFCVTVLFAATLAAIFTRRFTLRTGDPYKCTALLERGRWSHEFELEPPHLTWHPDGCLLRDFSFKEASHCLKSLTIVGDSTARQLFWKLADRLKSTNKISTGSYELSPLIAKHANMTFELSDHGFFHFIWDPFLNNTDIAKISDSGGRTVVIAGGLWHARHLDRKYVEAFEHQVTRLVSLWHNNPVKNQTILLPEASEGKDLLFLPIIPPVFANLSPDRSAMLTFKRIWEINEKLRAMATEQNFDVMWATIPMTDGHDAAFALDGLHVSDMIASRQLDLLVNRLCNRDITEVSTNFCCSEPVLINAVQLSMLVIMSLVVFYWVQAAVTRLLWRSASLLTQRNNAMTVFAISTLYCYLADRTTLFEQSGKLVDERVFFVMCLVSMILGVATLTSQGPPIDSSEKQVELLGWNFLTRRQTEEWKGWMQLVILLYHYFGMSRVLRIYRVVRVLVASYFFLTGYGHTRYLIKTNDFSLRRVFAVLIRLNLLACVLPFVMGTTYNFYYFPALSSLWFLVTWTTVPRKSDDTTEFQRSLLRIAASMATMELLLSASWIQIAVFSALDRLKIVSVDQREFVFRARLDRYVPFLGMITALLQHHGQQFSAIDMTTAQRYHIVESVMVISSIVGLLCYFLWCSGLQTKEAFNNIHPFTSPVPILAYVVLRNATTGLRSRYSSFFAWIGRQSLETYILQYHIWLAADTKGILHLGLLDRWDPQGASTINSRGFWAEVTILTIIFLWISAAMSKATALLTNWFINTSNEEPDLMWTAAQNPSPIQRLSPQRRLQSLHSSQRNIYIKVLGFLFLLWLFNIVWRGSSGPQRGA